MDIDYKLELYNTLSRRKEGFVPVKNGEASMYLCGPTVYDLPTIGNYRTYIFGDIIKRVLSYDGYKVNYVQNITDVGHLVSDEDSGEDKMEKGARMAGMTAREVADFFTKQYFEDCDKLNIGRPTTSCKATDNIEEQIKMVQKLEEKGYTYKTSDGIYFDTSKKKDYGKLAGLNIEGLKEGARVEKNPEKKNITDFALWKFSPKDAKRQMEWESPWGVGFPGWHIECSAMSTKYLGEHFDIHAGAIDLIPVHHTNEIAQNEAIYGHKTVNYWLHGGFLSVDNQRMGKSLGNAYKIKDLEEKKYSPLAFRYFTFTAHYRQPLNFTWEALEQANTAYLKLIDRISKGLGQGGSVSEEWNGKFIEAINDDLNMPKALAVVWEMMKSELSPRDKAATIAKFDEVLGLSLIEKAETITTVPDSERGAVEPLIEARSKARQDKNWAESDRIRKEIEDLGYKVEDSGDSFEVFKK